MGRYFWVEAANRKWVLGCQVQTARFKLLKLKYDFWLKKAQLPARSQTAKGDLGCDMRLYTKKELSLRELFFITRAVLISRFWTVVGLGEPENRISHLSNILLPGAWCEPVVDPSEGVTIWGGCLGPLCWMVDACLLFFSVGPCLKKNPSLFLLKSSKLEMEWFFVTSRGFAGLRQKLSRGCCRLFPIGSVYVPYLWRFVKFIWFPFLLMCSCVSLFQKTF